MYLKRLEMQGFKSFADKTILEFMPGITTVIGPNGSGKSNISDAIRWVLGEQSMKSLRGAKSEDVIFAGTQNRKSLGFAEASLVFDNSDGKLPVEYQEVVVTRKLYRSGESGYYINKVPCRLKDVLELFMDTGIGKDGYSIIGQGKIDEILSNKSEDRRHIFEEAAGVVKYRVRKTESEKKLEQTKLNLLRINDILSEIESTIEPLKLQSEKAKQFLDLREELKSIEIGLFLYHIDSYKEKLEKVVTDEEILNNHNAEATAKMEEVTALKEKLKTQIDEITSQIEAMQNMGFESAKEKERMKSDIQLCKEKIAHNQENNERFEKEIEEIKIRNASLEEEKKAKLEKKNHLFTNKEKFQTELEEKEKELETLIEKLSAKELEIEEKKKIVEQNTDLKYEKTDNIHTMEANMENIDKRCKQIHSEIDFSISELDRTRVTKEEIAKEFYEIENKRNAVQKQLESIVFQKQNAENKIKQYEEKFNTLSSEYRMKESRLHFLEETEKEKEGYVKSVKSLLLESEQNANFKKGMHGVLANIIHSPKEYETAIEMSLGASLQNIVTETEQDAKKMVEYLRTNHLGRASFLPITSVKGKKLEKYDATGISGIIGIASDVVTYDPKYEQIVLNLLGKTVIVEEMDIAIQLAKRNHYSFRIVTMKGDFINPSGAITGGSIAPKTVNILGRTREIEELQKTVSKLKRKMEQLEKEKQEYKQSTETVLEEITALEKNLQEIDIVYATNQQKQIAIEDNIHKIQTRLDKLKAENMQLQQQKEETIANQEKEQNDIQLLLEQNTELNRVIEQFANLNQDNQRYIDDLKLDVTNLKISVSSFNESEASIDEMVERIHLDIENNMASIEKKCKQKETMKQDNLRLEEQIQDLEAQIKNRDEKVEQSSAKVIELKESRTQKNEEFHMAEQDFTAQLEVLDGLKEQFMKIEIKKTKINQDIEQIINKLWEEYELTPNTVGEYVKPENVQETTKKVNRFKK